MRIYLDHNAGTPMRPAAIAAMTRTAEECHGNPAAVNRAGQYARKVLEESRCQVSRLIGAPPRTIIFTSGGTEANNLAIFGAARASGARKRIISSAIEHSSVLAPLAELERGGFVIERLTPDGHGSITPDRICGAIGDDVALVTIGLANAEVGTIQQIDGIAEAATRVGALFHLDAAQALGRMRLDAAALGCDLMSLSAHKLGGPPGCGALYVRPGAHIESIMLGGPQEAGLRAGTPNLPGAAGFGAAAAESDNDTARLEHLRIAALTTDLHRRLMAAIPGVRLNGPADERLPNTLNLTFPDVLGESLLIALDLEGVEVSMGSACAAGAVEPSHVLIAMGRTTAAARSSLRISLGWTTTASEIEHAAAIIPPVYQRVAAVGSGAEAA